MSADEARAAGAAPRAAEDEQQDALSFLRAGRAEAELVSKLTAAIKVSRIHALENVVAQDALEGAAGALNAYLERRDRAEALSAEGRVYVNGRLVLGGRSGGAWIDDFLEVLSRMGLGGVVFAGAWSIDTVRWLLNLIKRLGAQGTPESRAKELARLVKEQLPPPALLTVLDPEEAAAYVREEEEGYVSEAERAGYLYGRLLALAEASHTSLAEGRSPDAHSRHLRQTLMKIIDRLSDPLFRIRALALTALPSQADAPLASHVSNVAVLSVAMGQLLGLDRGRLVDLGFTAVHHDLGRVGHEHRADEAQPDREERASLEEHVLRGLVLALRGRSYGNAGLLRVAVSQEHHRRTDGVPEAFALRDPHLYSRIVAVADAFERLQNGAPWGRPALGPAAALRALAADAERYDPDVVGLLRDVLGRFPRGTTLRLWDGSVGVVLDGGARRGHRPLVRRLLLADGTTDDERALMEVENAERVATEVDPAELFIDWRTSIL